MHTHLLRHFPNHLSSNYGWHHILSVSSSPIPNVELFLHDAAMAHLLGHPVLYIWGLLLVGDQNFEHPPQKKKTPNRMRIGVVFSLATFVYGYQTKPHVYESRHLQNVCFKQGLKYYIISL